MEPMMGRILATAITFAPRGYTDRNGQMLRVNDHAALFSLMSSVYGGDGRNTLALPDLRGRVLIGTGTLKGAPLTPMSLS